jgi:pSer/pThr/pTyr-binding forkhead associated (FHA) protein
MDLFPCGSFFDVCVYGNFLGRNLPVVFVQIMDAKLKINGKTEITIGEGVFSIGRTSDNFLPLNDSNISRYHAEIESKNGGYTLIELGSSNGTTVNGTPLTNQITLRNGDVILFGGSSEVIFNPKEEETQTDTPKIDETPQNVEPEEVKQIEETPPASSKMPLMIGIAAVTVGLAIVAVVAVGLIYFTETKCEATARITSPDNGETITKATEIEVDARNTECVGRARFELNGEEIATANQVPYTTTLDPSQFPELADGGTYDLQVILEDKGGKTIQTSVVSVAFDTIEEKPKNTPTPEIVDIKPTQQMPKTSQSRQISLADTQAMYLGILKQFSGNFKYKPDTQFYQQLQAKTNEYRAEGYFANAQKYSDVIKVAFVQENGLDAPLGYLTAMSRSKFSPTKDKNDEGLWRMTNDFASVNAFNGTCGSETLSDASQNCAAKSAAVYLKALILNVFEGDVVYGISCFGMSPNEASAWKQTLPQDKTNFWQVIKNPKQKEEIVKFFAAAIVAENPQKFGLKRDRPISEIYKVLMAN